MEDLAEYNFEIIYTPGHHNQAADMLSRIMLNPPEEDHTEVTDSIPEGLRVVHEVPGGGRFHVHVPVSSL